MAKRSKRRWILWGPLLVTGLGAIAFASGRLGLGAEQTVEVRGQAVARGPLRITVLERGNLQAADSVVLKSAIEGRTTILFLIEEGTWVDEGDLVCELDTAALHEQRVTQEISVQNREAAWIKAKQNHAIQESENESSIGTAERTVTFSQMDLKKYVEGDYPQRVQQIEEEILLAQEELQRAVQDLEWSERLAERGFLENTQLEADRLAKNRAEIQLKQKQRSLDLLKEYEHPRQLEELKADVTEAEHELERVRLRAQARIVDFEAEVRTTSAQRDLEREKLAKIDSQIEKAKLYAPRAGMVVYWQESGDRWGGSEPLQEGSEVRERQEIVTLPSAGKMIAEASLHESVLEKVRIGMPVAVTVDAIPGQTFAGRVRFKAVLPDQVSRWMNPDLRVYRTEIALTSTDERLRPGMSCSVEIVVDEIADTLYVPLQAVFLDAGDPVCFVSRSGGAWDKRSVQVGQNDGKWVELKSGLKEGEVVLLSVPLGAELRPEPAAEVDQSVLAGAAPQGEGAPGALREEGGPPRGAGAPGAGLSGRGDGGGDGARNRPRGGESGVASSGAGAQQPSE